MRKQITWCPLGSSVQGYSHIRKKTGNQDFINWYPQEQICSHVVIAVADGHGSEKCERSDVGAQLAVKAAIKVIGNLDRYKSYKAANKHAEKTVPGRLVKAWKKLVDHHMKDNPADDGKIISYVSYGTTILAAYAHPEYILYLQLGDGDIITVNESGKSDWALPSDELLFANETTSLCSENATKFVRVSVVPASAAPPLILLSTDGYANSYKTDDGFLQVGQDIYNQLREKDGTGNVKMEMNSWLNEVSMKGSGDDVTLGLLFRIVP